MIEKIWHRGTRLNQISALQDGLLTVVDIGTSKISCAVLKGEPAQGDRVRVIRNNQHQKWHIIGHSVTASQGMEGGMIRNAAEVEHCLRKALSTLFRMSRVMAKYTIVGFSGPITRTTRDFGSCLLSSPVTNRDISKAIGSCKRENIDGSEFTIQEQLINIKIDGVPVVGNPIGKRGRRIVLDLHRITVPRLAIDRMLSVLHRCGLTPAGVHMSSLASGMSTLVESEISKDAIVVDIGSSTTNVAAFSNRQMIWTSTLAIGGQNLTDEICTTFGVNREQAERIKVLHGNTIEIPSDNREILTFTGGNDDKPCDITITRSTLHDILNFRLGEIHEGIAHCLDGLGWKDRPNVPIVLTGGGSRLAGFPDSVQLHLGRKARVGLPVRINGMPTAMHNEQCSALVGLILLGISPPRESWDYPNAINFGMGIEGGFISRTSRWLAANW